MSILLPKPNHENYGIFKITGQDRWVVQWTEDGKPRRRSFKGITIEELRKQRDAIFEHLKACGAVVTGTPEAMCHSNQYIYRRPRYVVRVANKRLGEADDLDSARKMRDKYLEKLKKP